MISIKDWSTSTRMARLVRGVFLIGVALLIYFMNQQAGRLLGIRWPWLKTSQRIGAAMFIALGIFVVVVGVTQLL